MPYDSLPADAYIPPGQVAVDGLLGSAMALSEHGRLRTLPEWNNGALIKMFTPEARKQNQTTDWYGEHAGKWLYAASLAVGRTGNDTLRKLLLKTAGYLVANQEADGYMGTYSPQLRITSKASLQHQKSWDVWSLGCMVLGLLELNKEIPDERYLGAAKKIGELLLKTFGDGAANITNYGTRYGYSATVVLDPVVELYKATHDQRYLNFGELIVKEVEQRDGLRLIASMQKHKDLETVADGKAYQIIWNLTGLAKLYEVTHKPQYLEAVESAWKNIRDYHLTITGGPWGGIGKHKECFNTKGYWNPSGFVETCSIMAWIQLNKLLLHLTGEARYAQETEKAAYNALLGAQLSDGQLWTYHSFTNGRIFAANYNDCCPSSGAMALEELTSIIYTKRQGGIACNLFTPGSATIALSPNNTVQLIQQTRYPFDGKIKLIVKPSQKSSFPLFIRIPDWAKDAVITVEGQKINKDSISSGAYYRLVRDWDQQNVIELDFPMPLRVVRSAEFATMPQGTADMYRADWFAVTKGPLVYAGNGLIDHKDRERNFQLSPEKISSFFTPVSGRQNQQAVYFRFDPGGIAPLIFVPFYEAGGRKTGGWRLAWFQNQID
ncbi:hypothetical protein A8C56_20700 [Niabella ginsenosidivorans]|uniref:DUF1680 family protein n=1 Tax=Niabella ginsenosidivorans TaxID=1176587 RepID=A0A1A9I9R4_9BACT|nr:hypothetical protein A8C56_20700 [Niabella ginsenosidivorans]